MIRVNQDQTSRQAACLLNCGSEQDTQLYGAPQQIQFGLPIGYFAALAINWNDNYRNGLTVDFRLINNIVCIDCVSNSDVQCEVYNLWTDFHIGTFKNLFAVPSMEPHGSEAYKLKCKYL
jgi:hypothetical protein